MQALNFSWVHPWKAQQFTLNQKFGSKVLLTSQLLGVCWIKSHRKSPHSKSPHTKKVSLNSKADELGKGSLEDNTLQHWGGWKDLNLCVHSQIGSPSAWFPNFCLLRLVCSCFSRPPSCFWFLSLLLYPKSVGSKPTVNFPKGNNLRKASSM